MNDGKQEVRQKSYHSIWTLGTLSGLDFRKDVLMRMKTLAPPSHCPGLGLQSLFQSACGAGFRAEVSL